MGVKNVVSENKRLVDVVVEGIEEKKGLDIVVMDMKNIHASVCDYFVVCHANSDTQVKAISDSVLKMASKQMKEKPLHVEGEENAEWVLIDFVDVVVHVFQKDMREFYNLEELWADADIKKIESVY